jgi:hypothetical protein
MSILKDAFERDFDRRSDILVERFYRDRRAGFSFDDAVTRHRERWVRLRVAYSQHPAADRNDIRYVRPLPYVDTAAALRAIRLPASGK